MDNKDIYIIGAGTYGAAILDLAETIGYNVIGFYDDDISKVGDNILGIPIIGKLDKDSSKIENKQFAIAIGNNKVRIRFADLILSKNGTIPTLIHPGAEISKYAKIGSGCIIHANAYIWTEVEINDLSIISPGVVIAHHTKINFASFISTGTNVGAGINIGKRCFIGIGVVIMTGVNYIGENCIIGAGSTVISNIEDNLVVTGSPAKVLRSNI